ncbi:MAG: DUF2164 domain-containing protein [Desulfuromonadaceae bacterium]|nr:DUF2164 domain-containing protein [Desulfuromonadaceae bacterium]MDD2855976.1 DUF2164 domain-containing protein [Desulfuromonadaceae bacterium]
MEFTLTKDTEKKLIMSMQRYVSENFETEIGNLQATLFLQFCMTEIGPAIYNRAITDAQTFIQERAQDLENSCFATESDYWSKQDKQKGSLRSGRIRN